MIRYFIYASIIIFAAIVLFEWKTLSLFGNERNETESVLPVNTLDKQVNLPEERELWSRRVDLAGAKSAYEEFKSAYQSQHFGIQHVAAHIFGEVLYDRAGVKGVAVCDNTFSFGCYHSFFGRALSENGKKIIPELDKACLEKYGPLGTGCQHGIGHGIVEYRGHDNVVAALNDCALTTQLKELFGCTSGVFMEYNVPIIITPETAFAKMRELNPSNPYEPCNTLVPERFRTSCYYEMGQWWEKFFGYEEIGKLCGAVSEEKEKEACYLGVGGVVGPSSNFNVAESIQKCKEMANFQGELICRAGASWAFFAMPEYRSLSLALCEGLNVEDEHLCVQKSDLVGARNL